MSITISNLISTIINEPGGNKLAIKIGDTIIVDNLQIIKEKDKIIINIQK